ncbi:EAL domain-containing protein [Cellulomonas sp. KRMCY2]|uniref:EAL domain-containing protein n=1 Tax=Cellulomonas sp. KRMCY2 TaxID=1304865 RepID=UPI0004B6275A|nr:EAL domain-containing protein [Cellulomonas sp. KRMCY2]
MDRVVSWGPTVPRWAAVVVVGALLAMAWGVVYAAGGTKTATPHLFYIPILLAVVLFGIRGASVVAVVAAVLAGSFLPIDTGTGEQQALVGMLVRGSSFLSVGVLASLFLVRGQRLDGELAARDVQDLLSGPPAPAVTIDTALIPLVADILSRRAFHPVFQPIYSLHNGRLVAVEALTRFDVEPYRPPDVWFAAAELAGLGADLEIAAIEAAIEATTDLPGDVSLSLNASPATLADPRLHELLLARDGRDFTLELTEHAVIEDYDLLEVPLAALRGAGVMIAVDDAGAGFASLQHIVQLSPDVIKLDISLTQNMGLSAVRRALGRALVEFVHHTGAMLVVEGIEDEADLRAWSELDADAVQGYLVGRPGSLPAEPASPIITALLDMQSDAIPATAGLPVQRSWPEQPVSASPPR